jgi:hypothetical protein
MVVPPVIAFQAMFVQTIYNGTNARSNDDAFGAFMFNQSGN